MNSFTTETPNLEEKERKAFSLGSPEEIDQFSQEYEIVRRLCVPVEMPNTIKAKEILYAAARKQNILVIEIDAEDIQDTSTLVEQMHIEERDIVRREGVLVRAMKSGHWLVVNSKEKENPITNYIVSEYGAIPGTSSAPHCNFQLFIFSKDYSPDSNRGLAYPMQMVRETPENKENTTETKNPVKEKSTGVLTNKLVQALIQSVPNTHTVTEESAKNIVSTVLLAISRYADSYEIECVSKEVEERTKIYYQLQMIIEQILVRNITSPEVTPLHARTELYRILCDILLSGVSPCERDAKEESLRDMMCVRCEDVESAWGKAAYDATKCLLSEPEYVLTVPAVRLILCILEGLSATNSFLLIGETGTGKTTTVQKIFERRKILITARYKDARKMLCVNLSKDTDISDLLGAYQFATSEQLVLHINDLIQGYFELFFNEEKNNAFLQEVDKAAEERRIDVITDTAEDLLQKFSAQSTANPSSEKAHAISRLEKALDLLRRSEAGVQNICIFVEGPLVRAALYGYWILLDESNLAPASTLRYINTAIQRGQLSIIEEGGAVVPIDKRTVIFQCMNPGDDHGKKNIEMDRTLYHWIDEIDRYPADILSVAQGYGKDRTQEEIQNIVKFYTEIKQMAKNHGLRTGSNRAALFGIRNLIRTLKMKNISVVEGIEVNFLTQLCISHKVLGRKLLQTIFPEGKRETKTYQSTESYIITPQVQAYISEIESAISTGTAVLLEGTTSVGKTSLIKYIAQTKNKQVVRINNHEHTDITEYLGTFGVADAAQSGVREADAEEASPQTKRRCPSESAKAGNAHQAEFVYKEGALVTAVRKGHWILLDELNLAPTEVLESLNRLLDSNRELFIPATQEVIKAHPEFALFATQNPAESADYRNRKHLSKAFRNRFIELYVEEKSRDELEVVLHGMRAGKVFTKVLLDIYEDLRILTCNRSHEYITLRELMKILRRFTQEVQAPFIDRMARSEERLFYYTMLILTEKLRAPEERQKIESIICTHFEKTFKKAFTSAAYAEAISVPMEEDPLAPLLTPSVTRTLRKIEAAWVAQENILLVGAPGIGKTYLSEYISRRMQTPCTVIGMHAGIELSDFVGGYVETPRHTSAEGSSNPDATAPRFTWKDGPLLVAMQEGSALIIDEINLVPDSVLESLNELFDDRAVRVHETGRHIRAHPNFRIIGTMNPGDDHGKREMSKSISTRLTTIYMDKLSSNAEAVSYFLFYTRKYGLPADEDRASLYYRALHKALQITAVTIDSAREAEVLARYVSNYPIDLHNADAEAITQILCMGIELVRQIPSKSIGEVVDTEESFGVHPFILQKSASTSSSTYTFAPPSVQSTLYRIVQGLFCRFNLLLEGPPGTGKTKIIEEIGRRMGKRVTRVNLSSETEMADLTGRNTPTDKGILFIEGEFIRAITRGDWIIIDEINLATQSVLEGLNGCLDYRRRIFVPEMGSVNLHPETVIFGTMNPKVSRTDGRKLLPKSFLSRFIRISREAFTEDDLRIIMRCAPRPAEIQSAEAAEALISRILQYRARYSLNLRDCLRHMATGKPHLIPYTQQLINLETPCSAIMSYAGEYLPSVKLDHAMCTTGLDREEMVYHATETELQVGSTRISCDVGLDPEYVITHGSIPALEALINGMVHGWPCIIKGPLGKGRLARFFATITGNPLCALSCHKDMEPAEFLGKYVKAQDKEKSMPFLWEDSPFIQAVETGSIILLKNINLVKNDVIDRLNSLFEVGGSLEIHEKGGSEIRRVVTHPNTRFIFTLAESAKELSPALINRSVQVNLPATLSMVDLAKILQMNSTETAKRLSTSKQKRISSGLLHAHIQARKVLDYNTVHDTGLRALLPLDDLQDLKREEGLKNYLNEKSILHYMRDLAQNGLEKELLDIGTREQMEEALPLIIKNLAEHSIDPEYREVYRNTELHKSLQEKYEICAAFAKGRTARSKDSTAQDSTSTLDSTAKAATGSAPEPLDVLNRLMLLKNKVDSGESALRAYFEAMDMPILSRKEASVRMARIKLVEAVFSTGRTSFNSLKNLPIVQEIALLLDGLSGELEREIADLETTPPAYDALNELLSACLQYGIDPLIFLEIQKIEEQSKMRVECALRQIKKNYYLYKYGVRLVYPPLPVVKGLNEIREKRRERNFKRFAYYLQGVIKDAMTAEYPELLAFSLIRRDMHKYSDLWECFSYALLKSGIERIAQKKQVINVSEIGLATLEACDSTITAESGLSKVCKVLLKNNSSFLSLTPLHSRCVQVLWRVFSQEAVDESEIFSLCGLVLSENSFAKDLPEEFVSGVSQYHLSANTDKILSAASILHSAQIDLSISEKKAYHTVSISPRIVELIDQVHLEVKNAKNLTGRKKHDWGEDDGAKEYLMESIGALRAAHIATPAQKIAAELDLLNENAIHINILSTPLNTARHAIYKLYTEHRSYNIGRYTEIQGAWLLHLFSALHRKDTKNSSTAIVYAIEEFLLQSTVGDMEKRVEIIRQMVGAGGQYQINNILVYFLPYLECVRRKREKTTEAVKSLIKEIETALSIKMKTDGTLVPIREKSILIKAEAIKESLEGLLAPIISVIKPQLFHRSVALTCACGSEECYVCMAKEVERQKMCLEKESMSVKLRALYLLFEKLSVMMPAGISRIGIIGAKDFYMHVFDGTEDEHIVLAKIVHVGTAVLRADPVIHFQIATRISDTTIKLLNYSMQADLSERRLILVSLGLFFELMTFGFCGDDEEDGLDGLIDELEDAGMRLGDGEKNISEKLKKEEEVGDDYKGEKDMQSEEIDEEDGVDCENAGEVQKTAGAEDKSDIEVDNGSVSDNEEEFNQKNKKDTNATEEAEDEDEGSGEGEEEEPAEESESGEGKDEDVKEIDIEDNPENPEEPEELNIQDMEMCDEEGGEFNKDDLEEVEDNCSLEEESLEGIALETGDEESSEEEVSIEKYESEEYENNVKQYDIAEVEVNPEQLFNDQENIDEMVGNEEGEGAEREVAVDKGDEINENAEDVEEALYTGEYKETAETEAPEKAPFERPAKKSIDPIAYYEKIKHITNPELTKQLSVVLEENEKSAYEGDYISGRRLNMKRIISYIASDGQKNRIWMRKSKNQGREYLIRIFVDNSGSIKNSSIVDALVKSLTSITNSLDLLNVPFELHTFSCTVHPHKDMRRLIEGLTFNDKETRISWVFNDEYKHGYNIIISDGLFYDSSVSTGVLSNTLLLLVGNGDIIKEMRTVKAVVGEVVIGKYLDTLAIPYCIVDEDNLLEVVFCRELKNILRLARRADN
ncbi:midasin [Nematocida parisii]|nr:midasin [Nematocida parisii]KAI5125765.1 midasin [Nematocida parisii]KAI5140202.1 midasin [Nematocida parisii]